MGFMGGCIPTIAQLTTQNKICWVGLGAGVGGGRWGREMGAGDRAGGSLSAKEIFVCEGDLCPRRRSLSAKEIFLCGGDLSLLW